MRIVCVALIWASLLLSAPKRLSETGLYTDVSQKAVDPSHLYFEPQYPLWSDGAQKQRWIHFPKGTQIDNKDPDAWIFPVGTKVWKEFSFPLDSTPSKWKRVETRYLEKLVNGSWEMVTYVWDRDELNADLAPTTGIANHYPLPSGVNHDIPSVQQCGKCHNKGGDKILGFDVLQLSDDRDPLSLHVQGGELPSITLKFLLERKWVKYPNSNWESNPPRIHSQSDRSRAAMGYLHGNCGHCHNPSGNAAMTRQYLRHSEKATNESSEPAFSTTVNQETRFFDIPGETVTYRILPGEPEISAVHYRLETGSMPSIGKKIIDREAAELIRTWIQMIQGRD